MHVTTYGRPKLPKRKNAQISKASQKCTVKSLNFREGYTKPTCEMLSAVTLHCWIIKHGIKRNRLLLVYLLQVWIVYFPCGLSRVPHVLFWENNIPLSCALNNCQQQHLVRHHSGGPLTSFITTWQLPATNHRGNSKKRVHKTFGISSFSLRNGKFLCINEWLRHTFLTD